jgi:lantibiotic modifying enzyme
MRLLIFFTFLWLIFGMAPTKRSLDSSFLNVATQAARWILSREADEDSKSSCWPSRANLSIEEKCDLYYGNAGVLIFLRELYRATGQTEYADAIKRDIAFLDHHLAQVELYGLYDGLAGIAFSLAQETDDPQASTVCSQAVDSLIHGAKKQTNGGVRWNDDNDIMSGSAGIGLGVIGAWATTTPA